MYTHIHTNTQQYTSSQQQTPRGYFRRHPRSQKENGSQTNDSAGNTGGPTISMANPSDSIIDGVPVNVSSSSSSAVNAMGAPAAAPKGRGRKRRAQPATSTRGGPKRRKRN